MKAKIKSSLVYILKLSLAAGMIYYLVNSGYFDFEKIKSTLTIQDLFLFLGIALLNFMVAGYRWHYILAAKGFPQKFKTTISLQFIGLFFNFFMPGSVGGDVVKGYYLAKSSNIKVSQVTSSILLDRVLGLYNMLLLALLAVAFNWGFISQNFELKSLSSMIVMAFSAASLGLVVAFSSRFHNLKLVENLKTTKLGNIFDKVTAALKFPSENKKHILMILALSTCAQVTVYALFYFVAKVFNYQDVTLFAVAFAVPLGMIMTSLPLAPAGIGVGQVAMAYLFNLYLGSKTDVGVLGITIFQFSVFILSLVGAVFYLQSRTQKSDKGLDTAEVSS